MLEYGGAFRLGEVADAVGGCATEAFAGPSPPRNTRIPIGPIACGLPDLRQLSAESLRAFCEILATLVISSLLCE
jgi:hypothetical protein